LRRYESQIRCDAICAPATTEPNIAHHAAVSWLRALGIRVDKPGDLRPSLERALAGDRPAVIDVRTDIDVTAPLAVS